MSDLDPAELSAFLDGELDPRRAAEVAAMIESDDAVRADYEGLRRLDSQWRTIGRRAAFRPDVRLPEPAPAFPAWGAAALVFILLASVAGKLAGPLAQSLALNAVSLVTLVLALLTAWSRDRAEAYPAP